MNSLSVALSAAAILASSAFAQGLATPTATVLLSNEPADASGLVPGSSTVRFLGPFGDPFRDLVVTPSGDWAILAATQRGPINGEVAIRNGRVVVRRNSSQPFTTPGLMWSFFTGLSINDDADLAINGTAAAPGILSWVLASLPVTSGSGPSTIEFLSGDPGTVLSPSLAGLTIETILSPAVTNSDDFGAIFVLRNPPGPTTAFAFLGSTLIAQEGTTPPGLLPPLSGNSWDSFLELHVARDSSSNLVLGRTQGPGGFVEAVAVDGTVVLQGGAPIPGSGFPLPISEGFGVGFRFVGIHDGGLWYASGENDDPMSSRARSWIVENGVVVADTASGQEIFVGAGEHWGDSSGIGLFFSYDVNAAGDRLVVGETDGLQSPSFALVMSRPDGSGQVFLRRNDPVDLNGDGLMNDDRFVLGFPSEKSRLLPDGSCLSVISMRTGGGAPAGNALVRIGEPTASCTITNGSGVNPVDLDCVTEPRLGNTWQISLATTPTTTASAVLLSFTPSAPFTIPGLGTNEFLIDLATAIDLQTSTPGSYSIDLPRASASAFWELPLFLQGIRFESTGGTSSIIATNRIDAVLGF